MKRNFKYVKKFVNGKFVWKKASSNLTTWAPGRSMADIRKVRRERALKKLQDLGLLGYFRPGLEHYEFEVRADSEL
jgi:hypothetical protein